MAAGEEARLDFKTAEMNDVLKSFTVTDLAGGRVTGVRYDANEPLDQQLAQFPFNLGDSEFVSAFIDRMKGAQIELKTGDAITTGTIMSARAIESGAGDDKRLVREQVTLLLGTGVPLPSEALGGSDAGTKDPAGACTALDDRSFERSPEFLVALIANKELAENARKQIEQISGLKQNIIDADSEIAGMKAHSDVLNGEQSRLRQNIDSLNRVKGQEEQVRQYSGQLAANELELRKLRDQITDRSEAKTALEKTLGDLVKRLEF